MRDIKFVVAIVVLSCYVTIFSMTAEARGLSTKLDLEMERYVRIIDKYTVQTIEEDGDIYNCVDIYNQPSLRHPLLRDHKIQLRPTFGACTATNHYSLKEPSKNITVASVVPKTLNIGLKNGCPEGTVPIRNTTKEQILMAKSTFARLHTNNYSIKAGGYKTYAAGYLSPESQDHDIGQVAGYINLYNPGHIANGQYTNSRIRIKTGNSGQMDIIEAGWTLNLDLYKDKRTRLYTQWTMEDHIGKKGCYNVLCPGFVIVNPNIPLDMPFPKVSELGGAQYDVKLTLIQDSNANWWLTINENDIKIGYWPSKILPNLKNGGDQATWGGEVFSTFDEYPPMGSGNFDFKNFQSAAYFRRIDTGTKHQNHLTFHNEESGHYYARDGFYKNDYWRFSFVFGGEWGKQ